MSNNMRNNMSNKTKTFSLSLDSVAILEAALRAHNDMLYDEGCSDAEWDGATAVEELRAMFSAVLKAAG